MSRRDPVPICRNRRARTDPSPGPRPDEVHRECGPPSPQGSLCDNSWGSRAYRPKRLRRHGLAGVVTQAPRERAIIPTFIPVCSRRNGMGLTRHSLYASSLPLVID
jgi:hypothetical protein